jgi:broad specificity phosphatase PhoE
MNSLRKLILVRHSVPEKIVGVPAKDWHLSTEGQQKAQLLAKSLVNYQPTIIAASTEPKAIETAQFIAEKFGKSVEVFKGLEECDRSNIGYLEEKKYLETIAAFFASPNKLVIGQETATQALQRFHKALENIISQTSNGDVNGDVVIVSHGIIITLFTTNFNGKEPFQFWQKLELPMVIILPLSYLNH